MDFLATAFIYWVFNLFCPEKKPPVEIKEKSTGGKVKSTEWGYFIFSDERNCKQSDEDPFLNSDYDNGPDW